jgi:hypothetical protein
MSSATFTDLTITNTSSAVCGIGAPLFVLGNASIAQNLCVQTVATIDNGINVQPAGNVTFGSSTTATIGAELFAENRLLVISTGLNARIGTASLVAGTVTILNNTLTGNSSVLTSRIAPASPSSNTGFLFPTTITSGSGGSFVIQSSNSLDNGSFIWWLIEKNL